jgi:hypothetical protein
MAAGERCHTWKVQAGGRVDNVLRNCGIRQHLRHHRKRGLACLGQELEDIEDEQLASVVARLKDLHEDRIGRRAVGEEGTEDHSGA